MLRFMPAFTCTRAVWLVLVLALYDHSPAAAATSTDTSAPASALCAFQTQAPVGFFRGFLLQHLKGVTLEQCAEACQARNKLGSDPSCRAFQYDSTAQKCGLKKVRARHHARLSCPALLSHRCAPWEPTTARPFVCTRCATQLFPSTVRVPYVSTHYESRLCLPRVAFLPLALSSIHLHCATTNHAPLHLFSTGEYR